MYSLHSSSTFFEVHSTRELEAEALGKTTLGSHTSSLIFPVVAKIRPTVALSLQKFSCEIVMVRDLEPSCHQMGPGLDYLTHGAAMSFAEGCPGEYQPLLYTCRSRFLFCGPAFVRPLVSHLVKELSSV